jgi:hypothetical protein
LLVRDEQQSWEEMKTPEEERRLDLLDRGQLRAIPPCNHCNRVDLTGVLVDGNVTATDDAGER